MSLSCLSFWFASCISSAWSRALSAFSACNSASLCKSSSAFFFTSSPSLGVLVGGVGECVAWRGGLVHVWVD